MRLFLTSYLAGTKGPAERFLSKARPREIAFVPTAAEVEIGRASCRERV